MRPDAKVWRKSLRREARGEKRGRRGTHRSAVQPPRSGSTWLRRHRWWPEAWNYYDSTRTR